MRLIIISFLFVLPTYSVRVTQKKICNKCKHFIGNKKTCALFGKQDLINGNNDNDYAVTVRNDNEKCGLDAKYFEENKMNFITTPYYSFIENWPIYLIFTIFGSYFAFLIGNII